MNCFNRKCINRTDDNRCELEAEPVCEYLISTDEKAGVKPRKVQPLVSLCIDWEEKVIQHKEISVQYEKDGMPESLCDGHAHMSNVFKRCAEQLREKLG